MKPIRTAVLVTILIFLLFLPACFAALEWDVLNTLRIDLEDTGRDLGTVALDGDEVHLHVRFAQYEIELSGRVTLNVHRSSHRFVADGGELQRVRSGRKADVRFYFSLSHCRPRRESSG